ncbi:unnamed protein product [Gongylonema pulchrum]|uniref:J domain-containing protein n=1 Tax=Gongylonema pulchrum TaxID=637853 RepID=A0A183ERK7_9BILA|nr:unnamed protein product [Gongylonema pulchrum]
MHFATKPRHGVRFSFVSCTLSDHLLQEKFFCPVCSAIQPIEDTNYFTYLGVRPGFDVDLSLLKKNFLKLQSAVHPDKFSTCSQKEQEISEHCSQYLNEAYKTLTEPLRRASRLQLFIGLISATFFVEASGSTDFLVEMMELNERVAAIDDPEELKNLLYNVERRIDVLGEEFKSSFEANQLEKSKEIVLKLTFYYRLKAVLSNKIVDNV